jgi:hypothetical protein
MEKNTKVIRLDTNTVYEDVCDAGITEKISIRDIILCCEGMIDSAEGIVFKWYAE